MTSNLIKLGIAVLLIWVFVGAFGSSPSEGFPEGCDLGPTGNIVCIHHRWEELPDGRNVECMVATGGSYGSLSIDCQWGAQP